MSAKKQVFKTTLRRVVPAGLVLYMAASYGSVAFADDAADFIHGVPDRIEIVPRYQVPQGNQSNFNPAYRPNQVIFGGYGGVQEPGPLPWWNPFPTPGPTFPPLPVEMRTPVTATASSHDSYAIFEFPEGMLPHLPTGEGCPPPTVIDDSGHCINPA